jgi:hypothetical protein
MDYISHLSCMESGGNCSVDFVHLKDGRVLGINDECVVLYSSMQDFLGFETRERPALNLIVE